MKLVYVLLVVTFFLTVSRAFPRSHLFPVREHAIKGVKTKTSFGTKAVKDLKSKPGEVLLKEISSQIRPNDDFYGAVNKYWLERTVIPEAATSVDALSWIREVSSTFFLIAKG